MPLKDPRYKPTLARDFAPESPCRASITGARQEVELIPDLEKKSMCSLVVDADRKFIKVSDQFCKLTGYSREQLTGMKHDDLIAPGTADIGKPNDPFTDSGCSEGLWLLVCRAGTRILVHYESHLTSDYLLHIEVEVVGAGYLPSVSA